MTAPSVIKCMSGTAFVSLATVLAANQLTKCLSGKLKCG